MKKQVIVCYVDCMARLFFFMRFKNSLKKLGFDFIFFTGRNSVSNKLKKSDIKFHVVKLKNFPDLKYKNIDLRATTSVSLKLLDETIAKKAYLSFLSALDNNLINHKVVSIWIWNGYSAADKAFLDYSKTNNIGCKIFELSNIPGTMMVDPEGVNARASIFKDIKILDSMEDVSEKQYNIWKENYLKRVKQNNPIPQAKDASNLNITYLVDYFGYLYGYAYERKPEIFIRLKNKVKMKRPTYKYKPLEDIKERFFFFPLQVSIDSQIALNSDIDVFQGLEIAISKAKKSGRSLVVKPHPAEPDSNIVKKINSYSDKGLIHLVSNNVFEIFPKCDKVVTINSTVGLQALIYNIPVEFLGYSVYKYFNNSNARIRKYLFSYLKPIDPFKNTEIPVSQVEPLIH